MEFILSKESHIFQTLRLIKMMVVDFVNPSFAYFGFSSRSKNIRIHGRKTSNISEISRHLCRGFSFIAEIFCFN